MDDRTATITIGCTEGADGYKILVNAPGDTKFKKMDFVKKHGKDEIVYLAKNLVNGGYLFKVKAYKVQGGRKIYGKASKTYGVSIGEQYTDYYAYEDSYINDPKPDEVVYESNGIWYDTEGNDVTDKIRWEEVYFVDAFSVTFDNTTAIDEVEKRRTIEKKGKWEESYWYWGPVTREDIRGLIDEGRIKKDEATYEIYNNACREPFKIDDIQVLDKLGIEAMS